MSSVEASPETANVDTLFERNSKLIATFKERSRQVRQSLKVACLWTLLTGLVFFASLVYWTYHKNHLPDEAFLESVNKTCAGEAVDLFGQPPLSAATVLLFFVVVTTPALFLLCLFKCNDRIIFSVIFFALDYQLITRFGCFTAASLFVVTVHSTGIEQNVCLNLLLQENKILLESVDQIIASQSWISQAVVFSMVLFFVGILIILDLMAFLIFNFDAVKRSEFERLFIPLKRLYTVDPTNVSSSEPLRQPFQSTFLRRERTDCDRENRHFGHGIVGLMN